MENNSAIDGLHLLTLSNVYFKGRKYTIKNFSAAT